MKDKKIISLLALVVAMSRTAAAASLDIRDHETDRSITGTTIRQICDGSGRMGHISVDTKLTLVNTSGRTLTIGAKKIEPHDFQEDVSHNFCFAGLCFPPFVFVAPEYQTLSPGATDRGLETAFKGTYSYDNTLHKPGVDRVIYVFYDQKNPSDSAAVTVEYDSRMEGAIGVRPRRQRHFSFARLQVPSGGLALRVDGLPDGVGPISFGLASISGARIIPSKISRTVEGYTLETRKIPSGVYCLSVFTGNRLLGRETFLVNP